MKATIHVSDNRIRVQAPFDFKDSLKALPGSRWQPKPEGQKGGWWTFPATATAAEAVHSVLDDSTVEIVSDESFQRLMKQAEVITMVQDRKSAEALPDIPATRTNAWLHQKQAFWFTKDMPAALLHMGMGTGKTKVVCDLIVNRGHMRTLVLCPKKVIPTWPGEMRTHGGAYVKVVTLRDEGRTKSGRPRTITIEEKVRKARAALALCEAAGVPVVIVINYESAWRAPFGPTYEAGTQRGDVRMTDKGFALTAGFDLVVMDEGHKIKAPGGRTSRFCAQFPNHIPFRLELTGTPMAHGPLDVYAQFRALDPGIFGTSFAKFRDRYAIMGGFEMREVMGYQNQQEFADKMARITYHVSEDVLDLPSARHQRLYCTLSPDARRLYDRMEADQFGELKAGADTITASADNVLVKMLRLQQIAAGFITDDDEALREVDTAKADLLRDTLTDLQEADEKHMVVFCKFTHDLDSIRRVAEGLGLSYGEISGRRDDLESFKAGQIAVVGVQIQAGGAGVDLTRADVAIYFTNTYSLGDYLQSLRRLDRPTFDGRKRSVLNIHLLAEGTIDEDVYGALEAKEGDINAVIRRIKARQAKAAEEAEMA